jgi:predicted amidohydrolase
MKVALIQQSNSADVQANIAKLEQNIAKVAAEGAELIVL